MSDIENVIARTLQSGIEAHKVGRLQDAEAGYRAVLQIQPKHPDANHNLGVLAVSVNKLEEALLLFKTALEANPNQGQFWISYVDALIKVKQFDNAKSVLEQGKKKGLAGEKVDRLTQQLTHAVNKQGHESREEKKESLVAAPIQTKLTQKQGPSQADIDNFLKSLQKKDHHTAKKLATSITQKFPKHPLGWKMLGVALEQLGELSEAVIANQKAVVLAPEDPEAHYNLSNRLREIGRLEDSVAGYRKAAVLKPDYVEAHFNLGITLQELGRSEEAETSYKIAIAIKSDYVEAYSNLGVALQDLGRLVEAEKSYKKALAIKPNLAEAHSNLGNILKGLGRLEEAETSYKEAIAIKPDLAESHSNLGVTLKELGRLEEAETSYKEAIAIKPNYAEAHSNLGNILKELGRLEEAETSYKKALAIKPDYAEAHSNLGNTLQELGRLEEAETSYAQAIRLKPEFLKTRCEMLDCLYQMDKKSLFFNELYYLIKQGKANSAIGSLTCRSALRYGEKKANTFCNEPLKHVLIVNLKSRYNFEEIFVRNVKSLLGEDKRSNSRENKATDEIQKAIRLEIERYQINFENSQEGFIRKWPNEYSLYGWLISMKSGGELHPHIHHKGWLSGSIYINVPPKSKIDSGNLVVALGIDSDTTNSHLNLKKVLDVVTGNMVLFPASLMHYTIPFESKEERIVLAFDVIPK